MKIYTIQLPNRYRPNSFPRTPIWNVLSNYSMEERFYDFVKNIEVNDKNVADFFYLPVFWSRLSNVDYHDDLKNIVNEYDINKIFTVNTFELERHKTLMQSPITIFSGGHVIKNKNIIDIPILTNSSNVFNKPRKYHITFMGSIYTNRKRWLNQIPNIKIIEKNSMNNDLLMSISNITFCPAGAYDNTIRIYEAMRNGSVPFIFSRTDPRPFKNMIDWDRFSFWTNQLHDINPMLERYSGEMNELSKENYHLLDKHWCDYILKNLSYTY